MAREYDRPLYILPFDHRGSFQGLDRSEDCQRIVAAATKSAALFSAAARTIGKCANGSESLAELPGFVGFAVGRTDFWDPLVAWRSKKATREQAVAQIAGRYRKFVDLFERATVRSSPGFSGRVRPEHRSTMEG